MSFLKKSFQNHIHTKDWVKLKNKWRKSWFVPKIFIIFKLSLIFFILNRKQKGTNGKNIEFLKQFVLWSIFTLKMKPKSLIISEKIIPFILLYLFYIEYRSNSSQSRWDMETEPKLKLFIFNLDAPRNAALILFA